MPALVGMVYYVVGPSARCRFQFGRNRLEEQWPGQPSIFLDAKGSDVPNEPTRASDNIFPLPQD